MTHQPLNILVTGGAGFIGSQFIIYMLQKYKDIQIINVDKLTYAGSLKNLSSIENNKRYYFYQTDICSTDKIKEILLQHKIDTIVHFAAESHVDRSIAYPDDFIKTNILGTFSLLEAAKDTWLHDKQINLIRGEKSTLSYRFHHISTDEVYGSLQKTDPPFTEQTPYSPKSPYSASKASADHLVKAYFNTYDLPVTISNCSNNYGPHQHPEKLIPTIINHCLQNKKIPIYNDGSNIRDWLYVKDHCHAIDLIIRHGQLGETYNIGGNAEWNNLELTKLICKLIAEAKAQPVINYLELIEFVMDRPGHDFRYAINIDKIKSQLNWQPSHSLLTGLKETVQWYIKEWEDSQFKLQKII